MDLRKNQPVPHVPLAERVRPQNIDEFIIREKIHDLLCFRKCHKNLCLQIVSYLCILRVTFDNLILFGLKVGELKLDELVEHLSFETERCNGEVKETDLHLSFWTVMGIW